MRYSELSSLEFDPYDIDKSISIVKSAGKIHAPDSVIEQFYIDHSDNGRFINMYGSIDIERLEWKLIEVETRTLVNIGDAATYPDFVKEVTEDASRYKDQGDVAIDCRPNVSNHWKLHGTWVVPPIFLDGAMLTPPSMKYHLVEGHTRVGCLCGVAKYGTINLAKKHKIYFGSICARNT